MAYSRSVKRCRRLKKRARIITGIGAGVFVLFLGAGIGVGMSGEGQIDVKEKLANQRANATPEEQVALDQMARSSRESDGRPNGGLRQSSVQRAPQAPATDVASTTASTTNAVASSTAAVASSTDEVADAPAEVEEGEVAPESEEVVEAIDVSETGVQ